MGSSWTARFGIVLAMLLACSGKVTPEGSGRDGGGAPSSGSGSGSSSGASSSSGAPVSDCEGACGSAACPCPSSGSSGVGTGSGSGEVYCSQALGVVDACDAGGIVESCLPGYECVVADDPMNMLPDSGGPRRVWTCCDPDSGTTFPGEVCIFSPGCQ